jgi:isopenicillin-N N-acyltransferase-like protein
VTLPVLHLSGAPYDQGHQHGRALRELIAQNLDAYFNRLEVECRLPSDEARQRAAQYSPTLARNRAYSEAMQGVADGSGIPLLDVHVLNLRYELLYFQWGANALVDGCTSFAVLPDASQNGHLLLGQNWDWIPEARGAIVHTRDDDGFETLGFTEAGIIGAKIGVNSAGLGLTINGLYSDVDDWSRLRTPFHVRCFEILRSRTLAEAVEVIEGEPRNCSTNFLIAQAPNEAVDIEAAPDTLRRLLQPGSSCTLVHSNHFVEPELLSIKEPPVEHRPHTYSRQARLGELLEAHAAVSIGDLESILRDHDNFPDSLCHHIHPDDKPEEWIVTVASVIMDLEDRSLRVTDGQPCERLYDAYSLAHMAVVGH